MYDAHIALSSRFNITESMVFEGITQVNATILELEQQHIVWPSEQEQRQEAVFFFFQYGKC